MSRSGTPHGQQQPAQDATPVSAFWQYLALPVYPVVPNVARFRVTTNLGDQTYHNLEIMINSMQMFLESVWTDSDLEACRIPRIVYGAQIENSSISGVVVRIVLPNARNPRRNRLLFPLLGNMTPIGLLTYATNLTIFYEHVINNEVYPLANPPLYKVVRSQFNQYESSVDGSFAFNVNYYSIRWMHVFDDRFVYKTLDSKMPFV